MGNLDVFWKTKLHYAANREDCVKIIRKMVESGLDFTDNHWRAMVTDVIKTHFDSDPVALMQELFTNDDRLVRSAIKKRKVGFIKATTKIMLEHLDRPQAVRMGPRKVMSPKERAELIEAVQDELRSLCELQGTDMSRNLDRRNELLSKLAELLGRGGAPKAQKWFEEEFPHLVGD